MDSLVSVALEEICIEGAGGIPLSKLWVLLQPSASSSGLDLCDGVKRAVWARLLSTPGLRFEIDGSSLSSQDPKIRSFEDSERSGLKVVAEEQLRDCFLGVYELKASGREIPLTQRRILDRVAITRNKGVTQNELAKELGMKGNEVFYHLRGLECNRLIVRQPTIVKTERKDDKCASVVNTNSIFLYRYAKDLTSNSHQRVEITKEETSEGPGNANGNSLNGDGYSGEQLTREDVRMKDYLPELEAVCNKLEEANGKVLVVKDIKMALGYCRSKGHRAWRNVVNRLKEAKLVEEFTAKVNKNNKKRKRTNENPEMCLRLLRKFEAKDFQPKTLMCGYDELSSEHHVKIHKKGQTNDQLVELPIEHQIYDMIDAEGSKGITISEVCSRLGLHCKKYYSRIVDMCPRFGMHIQAENYNRTKIYRVWTIRNIRNCSSFVFPSKFSGTDDNRHLVSCEQSCSRTGQLDSSSKELKYRKADNVQAGLELPGGASHLEEDKVKVLHLDANYEGAREVTELDGGLPEGSQSLSTTPAKLHYSQRHPCLDLTLITNQRKQRILSRLKSEKFILLVELHKWLESLETEKSTKMDKRTLLRILDTLQKEGHCKFAEIKFPSLTNKGNNRPKSVILHPSIASVTELVGQISQRYRDFDAECRSQALAKLKTNGQPMTILANVERSSRDPCDVRCVNAVAMRANGFVPARMVRTKLLHVFLWSYLNSSSNWQDALSKGSDLNNPYNTLKLLAIDEATKAMPLELFLQVVGSAGKNVDLVDYCQRGLRLLDLTTQECKHLMDANAMGRLLSIVDILVQMKLMKIVTEGSAKDVTTLTYAMELKPYIEVPRDRPSQNGGSFDHRPRIRHDFSLTNRDAVDAYWQTLEYCYATNDPTAASHAFPGSTAHEVFATRSWSSVRVMSTEQRMELRKRVANNDPYKKVSFKDCTDIARDLNLTLEQVLRASYDQRRLHLYRFSCNIKTGVPEHQSEESTITSRKRKRSQIPNTQADIGIRESNISAMEIESELDENLQIGTCGLTTKDSGSLNGLVELASDTDDKENRAFIHQCAFSSLKPKRRRKFPWNYESDRQLVIQYARYRVTRGASFYRVDWASISDLPAPPDTCKKRMAAFNKPVSVRNAVMRLCNVLGERYSKYMGESLKTTYQNFNDSYRLVNDFSLERCPTEGSSVPHETTMELNSQRECWDNFEDPLIKISVDEVLHCKRLYDKKESQDNSLLHGSDSDIQANVHEQNQVSLSNVSAGNFDHLEKHYEDSHVDSTSGQNRAHQLPGRVVKIMSGGDMGITRLVSESLGIASALELLKLVFLSTSAASEVQILLAETLRRYSESDIYAAFDYLRKKSFLISGHGSWPFVLSQKFFRKASSSPFPCDSGRRAANFSTWLHKQEQDLLIENVDLPVDLQCGETFHLFALVSSGELTMSICLPDEGIGETDDTHNNKNKGKASGHNRFKNDDSSWLKDSDFCLRREKGFPGIKVVLNNVAYSKPDSVQFFSHNEKEELHSILADEKENRFPVHDNKNQYCSTLSTEDVPLPCSLGSCHSFDCSTSSEVSLSESLLQDMTNYAEHFSLENLSRKPGTFFSSDLFKSTYIAIKQAGEQGLSMEEITLTIIMQDGELADIVVDTLEVFQLVAKVNAYDCVRVVVSSYKSKYFIAMFSNNGKDMIQSSLGKSQVRSYRACERVLLEKNQTSCQDTQKETDINLCVGHKVTILDLPEPNKSFGGSSYIEDVDPRPEERHHTVLFPGEGDTCIFQPILPWINAEGSTNSIMCKGLVRRLIGIIMQSPGILEEDLICQMDVLNPQSCRHLLELMILDNHVIVRRMFQTVSSAPPAILQGLIKTNVKKSEPLFRKHLFANPMSTSYL